MTEQTIQPGVQASTTPSLDEIDFFAEEEVSPQGDTAAKQGTAPLTKLQVKYNGAEQEFDLSTQSEEIKALIQKGMNYDHVKGEVDALKQSEEMVFLQEMATQAGEPDIKKFIASLRKDLETQVINDRVAQLQAEGMSARHAQQMAELEVKSKQASPQAPAKNEPDSDPLKSDFQSLLNEYPEVRQFKEFTDFPQEVQDMINAGKSPVVAYQKYLLTQKEAQAAVLNQNLANKSRDLGSMSSPGQVEKEDPFLAGLFGKR